MVIFICDSNRMLAALRINYEQTSPQIKKKIIVLGQLTFIQDTYLLGMIIFLHIYSCSVLDWHEIKL